MCVMSEECHSTVTPGADAMRNVALAAAAASDAMDRWRNRRSATSFRYEILWEVPNFWVGFFLVSRGMVGSVTRFHICPLSWKFFF